MATNLLWFVMAGFLLGFATSTLWEWFYFRKERLKLTDRRIRELEAKLRDADADIDSNRSTVASSKSSDPDATAGARDGARTRAWGDTAYRSPGVFLESEEFDEDVESDEGFAPERSSSEHPAPSATTSPTIPTVDSIVPKSTASLSGSSAAQSASSPTVKPTSQPTQPAAVNRPSVSDIPRVVEFASPADALRAKRGNGPRSRQEVLAALRRNSEAVQRGESPNSIVPEPLSEFDSESTDESSSLVSSEALRESSIEVSSAESPSAESTPVAAKPSTVRPSRLVSAVAPSEPEPEDMALQQSPARQRWANDRELTARSQEYPDDLSKIKGIGDVYKQRLYRAGIYTWKQIIEADSETLRRATSAYPSSNVEEWVTQAEKLMDKHGRKQAVYSGPQPDDMTKILGIGPVSAAALYRAGICTYEQLASLPIAELEALFPIAVAGDMPDFAQWVERAANLADEKHS